MGGGGLPLALLALGLLMIGGFVALVALGPAIRRQRTLKRRLSGLGRHRAPTASASREMLLTRATASAGSLDHFLGRLLPRRDVLRLRLERTGRKITLGQYFLISAALFLLLFATANFILGLGPLAGVLLGAGAAVGIPHFITGRMGKKRVAKFMMLLPDAIELMVRALRSGLPISEAIINAGQEVADPVGAEFRQIESALRLGRQLDDVMWDLARRLDVAEFRFLVISMGIQRETGGNLADTLATLADMLRRRSQMKLKIKALSSEARSSALVLGLLPFFVVGALMVTSPDYIGRMFHDPRGLLLCGLGLSLMATGAIVMAKIIDFDI